MLYKAYLRALNDCGRVIVQRNLQNMYRFKRTGSYGDFLFYISYNIKEEGI